jgi:uncharacterized surface protein with fasciclin (FAS1) repeats
MMNLTVPAPTRPVQAACLGPRTEVLGDEASLSPKRQDLTPWLQALALTGLSALLNSRGPLTLLAPAPQALRAWLAEQGLSLAAARHTPAALDALRTLLLNHVLNVRIDAQHRLTEEALPSLGGLNLSLHTASLPLALLGATPLTVIDASGTRATAGWVKPRPGQDPATPPIFLLDRVLQAPRHDLLQTLTQLPACSEFHQALHLSGWDTVLSARGPFTLFAPNNDSFAQGLSQQGLSVHRLSQGGERLRQLLGQHIVPGLWHSDQLPWGQPLRGVSELPVQLSALGRVGVANLPHVLTQAQALVARNGLIHVLNLADWP